MHSTIRSTYSSLRHRVVYSGISFLCVTAMGFGFTSLASAQGETAPIANPPEAEVGAANSTILGVDHDQEPGDVNFPQDDRRMGLSWDSQDDQLMINDGVNGTVWSNAGLRANDSILMINGQPVRTDAEVDEALRRAQLSTGDVDVTYSREGIRNRVKVSPWATQDDNRTQVDGQAQIGGQANVSGDSENDVPVPDGIRSINAIGMTESGGQLKVNQVSRNSIWANSGVRSDDVIAMVNNQRVTTRGEFQEAIQEAQNSREPIAVTVLRDGRLYDMQVAANSNANVGSTNRVDSYYRGPTPSNATNTPVPTMSRSYYAPYANSPYAARYPYSGSNYYRGYRSSYVSPYNSYYGRTYNGWGSSYRSRGLFRGGLFNRCR